MQREAACRLVHYHHIMRSMDQEQDASRTQPGAALAAACDERQEHEVRPGEDQDSTWSAGDPGSLNRKRPDCEGGGGSCVQAESRSVRGIRAEPFTEGREADEASGSSQPCAKPSLPSQPGSSLSVLLPDPLLSHHDPSRHPLTEAPLSAGAGAARAGLLPPRAAPTQVAAPREQEAATARHAGPLVCCCCCGSPPASPEPPAVGAAASGTPGTYFSSSSPLLPSFSPLRSNSSPLTLEGYRGVSRRLSHLGLSQQPGSSPRRSRSQAAMSSAGSAREPDPREGDPGHDPGPGPVQEGGPQEELDFSILFDYDYDSLKPIEEEPTPHKTNSPPSGVTQYAHDDLDCGLKPCPLPFPSLSADPMGRYGQPDSIGTAPTHPANAAGASAPSPRIEITPYHELMHSGGPFRTRDTDVLLVEHQSNSATTSPRVTLPVPGFEGYREPQCLSPASSGSSASFISETNVSPCTSPCVSPNNGPSDDLCPQFQNIHTHYSPRTSPIMSPRTSITEETYLGRHSPSPCPNSRSSSPGAKRRYSCTELYSTQLPSTSPLQSRTPSPQSSPRIPLREDNSSVTYTELPSASLSMDAMSSLPTDPSCGVPTKIWKTSPDPSTMPSHKNSIPCHVFQTVDFHGPCEQEDRRNSAPESILLVPPSWTKQLVPAIPICSLPVQSLPPLEWPVSSQSGSYELRIEVQPKPHHRAHYETEGSRGAVKAPTGGHPVVQLHGYMENKPLGLQIFIGTADERILKPHAFYQVHRITGKTVTTTSYEKIIGNTKVLEIPLEPKNNMKATIDCAGILKLRNADIELRKGETDIGRKNTRVRLVFRVHIPESNGRIISLQAASNPIECSQRSAHELPMVERQDIDSCLVYGGQQMILTGQNFTAESKVVFTEKTSDGQQIWEMEATVDKDKSQSSMLFVEVPEYRNKHIRTAVKVNFYVVNGKRKRSQPQHFTYHPVPSIKTEPIDDYDPALICNTVHSGLGTVTQPYYSQHTMVTESPSCLVATMAPCQQLRSGLSSPDSRYHQQNPSAVIYQRSKSLSPSQLGYQQSNLMATPVAISDAHRSVLVHAGSPSQTSAVLHHSPGNQQSSPVIHYSPTNQQLRCGSHQEFQHIMCCENFTSNVARSSQPQVSQAQRLSPSSYPTVIQQQTASGQRAAKNGPPVSDQKEVLPAGVTIKQEQNLDQAYLDDVNEIIRKEFSGLPARNQT